VLSTDDKKMRKVVMSSPGVIETIEATVPKAEKDHLVIRPAYIGICGSDIHVYHGKHPYTPYPVVQGHELSAVVVETGEGETEFKPGDAVTIEPQVSCGKCFPCKEGLYNICNELKVIGFQTEGTAADYVSIHRKHAVKLPKDMSLKEGSLMEPLAVAVRAVGKAGDIQGKQVLVIGAGPIGNLVAQTAKAGGASKVLVSDVNPKRLDVASQCGIDGGIDPSRENLNERIEKEFGKEQKADVIFECAGVQKAIESAVQTARKGTEIIVVAVYETSPQVDLAWVNECELTLSGTARYTKDDVKSAIELAGNGKVSLTPLITDEFELTEFAQAYQHIDANSEHIMKVLIRVNPQGYNKKQE